MRNGVAVGGGVEVGVGVNVGVVGVGVGEEVIVEAVVIVVTGGSVVTSHPTTAKARKISTKLIHAFLMVKSPFDFFWGWSL
ncbi:MAG: hypothetical protein A2857_00275 [Candidatus Levybacteria bacterium RIFCSPHIGHO2_01_FULL_36_15]|nr:MAG: hypothetical protein A2857_00275 [Candidatus Levybacteria bacterium RIFCSPHIGHO2_01_FULL_36_15]